MIKKSIWKVLFVVVGIAVIGVIGWLGSLAIQVSQEENAKAEAALAQLTVDKCPPGSQKVRFVGLAIGGQNFSVEGIEGKESRAVLSMSVELAHEMLNDYGGMGVFRGRTICIEPDPQASPPQRIVGLIPASPEKEGQK